MKRGHVRSHIETITTQATRTFPHDLLQGDGLSGNINWNENWKLWVQHWFKVAEKYYKQLEAEGLAETCRSLRADINQHREWSKEDLK